MTHPRTGPESRSQRGMSLPGQNTRYTTLTVNDPAHYPSTFPDRTYRTIIPPTYPGLTTSLRPVSVVGTVVRCNMGDPHHRGHPGDGPGDPHHRGHPGDGPGAGKPQNPSRTTGHDPRPPRRPFHVGTLVPEGRSPPQTETKGARGIHPLVRQGCRHPRLPPQTLPPIVHDRCVGNPCPDLPPEHRTGIEVPFPRIHPDLPHPTTPSWGPEGYTVESKEEWVRDPRRPGTHPRPSPVCRGP